MLGAKTVYTNAQPDSITHNSTSTLAKRCAFVIIHTDAAHEDNVCCYLNRAIRTASPSIFVGISAVIASLEGNKHMSGKAAASNACPAGFRKCNDNP